MQKRWTRQGTVVPQRAQRRPARASAAESSAAGGSGRGNRSAAIPNQRDTAAARCDRDGRGDGDEKARDQNPQNAFGASSSVRNAPPTGAMITLTSTAATAPSLRAMWPRPLST